MTLQPTKLPRKTPMTRAKAAAAIEHAILDAAQKASELTDFNWTVEGARVSASGPTREIVIRLRQWGQPT